MIRTMIRMMVLMLLILCLAAGAATAQEWGLDFSAPVDNPAWLALSSAEEPLSESYAPENLMQVSPKMQGVHLVTSRATLMERGALVALYEMLSAAQNDGVEIYIRQGYRSYADEKRRYESLTESGTVAQKPGESSYQTGLSVALVSRDWRTGDLTAEAAQTQEAQWLQENAADYGFVLRYPEGKEDLTGWQYEPWHYRYVGGELAAAMAENNLCLEEVRQVYDLHQQFALDAPVDASEAELPAEAPDPEEKPADEEPVDGEPVEDEPVEDEPVDEDGFLVHEDEEEPDQTPPPAEVTLDGVSLDPAYLMLASAAEPLPEYYEPANLMQLSPKFEGVHLVTTRAVLLEAAALEALYELLADAEDEELGVYVRQGYRSYAEEARRYESLQGSDEEAQKPGESSYQTGLSVTLVNKDYRTAELDEEFGDTKAGEWLADHCAEYGFVLRYPQNKEHLTGWAYEPWHFRYVGVEAARMMAEESLCLEEVRAAYDEVQEYQLEIATPAPTATPVPTPTPTPAPTVNPWIEYYSTGEFGEDGDYEIELFNHEE